MLSSNHIRLSLTIALVLALRYKTLYRSKFRMKTDGINSLNYERKDMLYKKLYTWILADLRPPS